MKKLMMAGLVALMPMAAAQAASDTEKTWRGEGDLAFNKASGNSSSEALLAKLKLVYERERWTHSGQIEAINTSENDARSAESYTLRGKSDYAISETLYGFGAFRYEDNRFSGYQYQASLSGGLGVHVINTDVAQFDIEGGLGYRKSEEMASGETFDEAIAIAAARYYRTITETTRFESDVNVESGQDNTYLESVVGVKVKINASLALKVAYTVKHNTDVPDGTKNTDTLTSVGLNYSF
ncbi:MAG: DUF481 domain-containing protein [Porticoccaceae bacterium]|nr:DUF481 domain-containing protein [Porticoccaceae bacterium]